MINYDKAFASKICDVVINLTNHGEGTLYANDDANIEIQTQFIYDLFNELKPKRVLEVGTAYGHFDYFILENFNCIEYIFTMDIFKESIEAVKLLNEKYNNKIVFEAGDSKNILTKLNNNFDLAWIDGSHHFHECISDLNNCARLNIPNIIVDDSQGEVWNAIETFLNENIQYKLIKQSNDSRIISYLRRD